MEPAYNSNQAEREFNKARTYLLAQGWIERGQVGPRYWWVKDGFWYDTEGAMEQAKRQEVADAARRERHQVMLVEKEADFLRANGWSLSHSNVWHHDRHRSYTSTAAAATAQRRFDGTDPVHNAWIAKQKAKRVAEIKSRVDTGWDHSTAKMELNKKEFDFLELAGGKTVDGAMLITEKSFLRVRGTGPRIWEKIKTELEKVGVVVDEPPDEVPCHLLPDLEDRRSEALERLKIERGSLIVVDSQGGRWKIHVSPTNLDE